MKWRNVIWQKDVEIWPGKWRWKMASNIAFTFIENLPKSFLLSIHTSSLSLSWSHNLFKKMDRQRPLFRLFSVFWNKQYNFYNKSMWKMTFHTAPGFEPTISRTWVVSHNHKTRAPVLSSHNRSHILFLFLQLTLTQAHNLSVSACIERTKSLFLSS